MSSKIIWTGLALILIPPIFGAVEAFVMAGAVVMGLGIVLMWLDK